MVPCVFVPHIIGNMIIKSIALYMMGFHIGMLLPRVPLYLSIAACECALIYMITQNKEIRKQSNYLK